MSSIKELGDESALLNNDSNKKDSSSTFQTDDIASITDDIEKSKSQPGNSPNDENINISHNSDNGSPKLNSNLDDDTSKTVDSFKEKSGNVQKNDNASPIVELHPKDSTSQILDLIEKEFPEEDPIETNTASFKELDIEENTSHPVESTPESDVAETGVGLPVTEETKFNEPTAEHADSYEEKNIKIARTEPSSSLIGKSDFDDSIPLSSENSKNVSSNTDLVDSTIPSNKIDHKENTIKSENSFEKSNDITQPNTELPTITESDNVESATKTTDSPGEKSASLPQTDPSLTPPEEIKLEASSPQGLDSFKKESTVDIQNDVSGSSMKDLGLKESSSQVPDSAVDINSGVVDSDTASLLKQEGAEKTQSVSDLPLTDKLDAKESTPREFELPEEGHDLIDQTDTSPALVKDISDIPANYEASHKEGSDDTDKPELENEENTMPQHFDLHNKEAVDEVSSDFSIPPPGEYDNKEDNPETISLKEESPNDTQNTLDIAPAKELDRESLPQTSEKESNADPQNDASESITKGIELDGKSQVFDAVEDNAASLSYSNVVSNSVLDDSNEIGHNITDTPHKKDLATEDRPEMDLIAKDEYNDLSRTVDEFQPKESISKENVPQATVLLNEESIGDAQSDLRSPSTDESSTKESVTQILNLPEEKHSSIDQDNTNSAPEENLTKSVLSREKKSNSNSHDVTGKPITEELESSTSRMVDLPSKESIDVALPVFSMLPEDESGIKESTPEAYSPNEESSNITQKKLDSASTNEPEESVPQKADLLKEKDSKFSQNNGNLIPTKASDPDSTKSVTDTLPKEEDDNASLINENIHVKKESEGSVSLSSYPPKEINDVNGPTERSSTPSNNLDSEEPTKQDSSSFNEESSKVNQIEESIHPEKVTKPEEPTLDQTNLLGKETAPESPNRSREEIAPELSDLPREETAPEPSNLPREETTSDLSDLPREETVPEPSDKSRDVVDPEPINSFNEDSVPPVQKNISESSDFIASNQDNKFMEDITSTDAATSNTLLDGNQAERSVPVTTELSNDMDEAYGLKPVSWYSQRDKKWSNKWILTQNENGPCPLLALSNILILRGQITIAPKEADEIKFSALIQLLADYLVSRSEQFGDNPDMLQNVLSTLPSLRTGLDVNVGFQSIRSFGPVKEAALDEMTLFGAFGVELVHGWVPDPTDDQEAYRVLVLGPNKSTYNDAMDFLVSADSSVNQNDSENSEDTHDALVITHFLEQNATQLTYHGLSCLSTTLPRDYLCVLFRNNHFVTLYKRSEGELYLLVTDSGFGQSDLIVWESFQDVDQVDSQFFTSNFTLSSAAAAEAPDDPFSRDLMEKSDHDLAISLQRQEESGYNATQLDTSNIGGAHPQSHRAQSLSSFGAFGGESSIHRKTVSDEHRTPKPDRGPSHSKNPSNSSVNKDKQCVIS